MQSIVLCVAVLITAACASLLAQHEAGKIAVANDAPRGSASAWRFDLLFVSNGRAERVLLRASRGVERPLFPDPSFPRRHVRRVTVRMAGSNLTAGAGEGGAMVHTEASGEYVVRLSPGLVASTFASYAADADAVATALLNRAMKDRWSDVAVDAALGTPVWLACHHAAAPPPPPLLTG